MISAHNLEMALKALLAPLAAFVSLRSRPSGVRRAACANGIEK